MIQITPPQNPQYWINQRALTFSENDLENVNRIAVSLVSGTVIMVYEKGVIDYAPDGNFQKWTLKGYSTRLVSNSAHHIYARLSRTEKDALIVFSINNYNIDGSITTIVTDANGNPVLDEDGKEQTTTSEPNPNYWYVKIGEITATVGNSKRELTYDSGALGTKKGEVERGSWTDMFELSKESTPWLIFVKQMFYEFTVKNPITLLSGLIFKNSKGVEKKVTDVKRSTDSDNEYLLDEEGNPILNAEGSAVKDDSYVPVSDETIPTTAYMEKYGKEKHLSRLEEDSAKKKITFLEGIEIGEKQKGILPDKESGKVTAVIDELRKLLHVESEGFSAGELGNGFLLNYDEEKKRSYLEVDEILVRKLAYFVSLVIKELKHVGGTIILTPASITCSKVEIYDTFYRCYFEQDDGEKSIENEFEPGDFARCQTFNIKEGTSYNVNNTYYWRCVVDKGDNYIDLSIADCDEGSGMPQKGDEIVQLGNRYDESRQNAIILSTVGKDAPSIKQYKGINEYDIPDSKAVTILSPFENKITGKLYSSATNQQIDKMVDDLKVDWSVVKEQVDQEFTIWFFDYEPSLENYPAVEWYNDELKKMHDQDIFYDKSSGRAYRFENGLWVEITDADTIAALEKAAKAQESANKAQSTADYASNVAKAVTERVNSIVADGILSALEKKEILKEWETITANYSENTANASKYAVSYTDYQSAYESLGTYLNGGNAWSGGIPLWLQELTKNQPINSSDYREYWVDYYREEKVLADAISEAIKKIADSKKKTFVSQPTDSDSYKVGDMWVNAYYDDGVTIYVDETLVCVQDKNVGEAFSISHWGLSNGYSASIRNLGDKVVIKSEYEKYQSELSVKFDGITAITSQFITNENGEIVGVTQSGLVSKSDFSTLFAQYVEEGEIVKRAELDVYVEKDKDGNIVGGIKLRADQLLFEAEDGGEIKLSADNINLNGVVSFAMFDPDLQSTINGKASSDALDEAVLGLNNTLTLMRQDINGKASTSSVESLTRKYNELNDELSKKYDSDWFASDFEYYLNNLIVNAAVNGSTLIVNGYINTDLIKTDTLIAKQVITDSDGTNYMVLRDGSLETRRASDDRTWFWINTGDNGVCISMMDGYDNHTVLQSNYVYLFNNSEGSSFIGTSKGVSFGSNLNRVSFESEGYDGVISVPAGKFRIVSAFWPKEANVGSGEMFVDGSGYVKVKSANLN